MGLKTEQRKKIDEALSALQAEALRTDPMDREACNAAFGAAYAARGLQAPQLEFCTSPWDVLQRLESTANRDNYRDIVGEEVILLHVLDEHDALMDRAENHRLTPAISDRTEKYADPLNDMGNFSYRTLMERTKAQWPQSMLDCGNNSSWQFAISFCRFTGEAALGILKPPLELTLGIQALLTCNLAHCFERYCFVSERPKSYSHPALTQDGPRGRAVIKWRDGFECDVELF